MQSILPIQFSGALCTGGGAIVGSCRVKPVGGREVSRVMAWHRRVVGVTGLSGSGKSTVAKLLGCLGAYVVDADEMARRATLPNSEGLKAIVEKFGADTLDCEGNLDRRKIGGIVFGDPEKRRELEAITHPLIQKFTEEEFDVAFADRYPLFVYDCPLLFEAGLDKLGFWKIVVVSADQKDCERRIMDRDVISQDEARARLAAQLPLELKRAKADIVIENTGERAELEEAVARVYRELGDSKPTAS